MRCINCGQQIPDDSVFCSFCGSNQATQPMASMGQPQSMPSQPGQPQPMSPQPGQPQPMSPQAMPPQPGMPGQPAMNSMNGGYGGNGGYIGNGNNGGYNANGGYNGNVGNGGKGGGNKTGLIIGIVAGICAFIIAAVLLVVLVIVPKVSGDGQSTKVTNERDEDDDKDDDDDKDKDDDDKDKDDKEEAKASDSDADKASNDTEEVTEEATEEPEPVPYAEEVGCVFDPLGTTYSGNAVMRYYQNDSDEYVFEVDNIEEQSATYSETINKVTVSEPDENGIVRYMVDMESSWDFSVLDTGVEGDWTLIAGYWIPEVYDYYTGYTFSYPDSTTVGVLDEDEERMEITREINGQQITVKQAILADDYSDSFVHDKTEQDGGTLHHFARSLKYIFVIYAPQDYDGLMLSLPKGDVNPDHFKKALETESEAELDFRLFEPASSGYAFSPETSSCLRLTGNTVPETPSTVSEMLGSVSYTTIESFDWRDDAVNGRLPEGSEVITDATLLEGWWKELWWWDRDNKLDSYGEELIDVYITVNGSRITWTNDHYQTKWGTDGDWEDMQDVDDEVWEGVLSEDGSAVFGSVGEVKITGFYTDGYTQFAVGTMMVQSGETADILLVRP